MATFFGEVQELKSRALDMDDDFCGSYKQYNLTVNTTENYSNDHKFKSMIFCVGKLAIAFSRCYLLPESPQLMLDVSYSCTDEETSNLNIGLNFNLNKNLKAAAVYVAEADVVVCEVSSEVPEEINVELLEIILKHVQCDRAVVLTSSHLATYKGDASLFSEIPVLMYLGTAEFTLSSNFNIPRLQSPNFVSNFPAAVLTEFAIRKKPALCVINFIETDALDSINVETFEKLTFLDFIQKHITEYSKSRLLSYVKLHSISSNLYI